MPITTGVLVTNGPPVPNFPSNFVAKKVQFWTRNKPIDRSLPLPYRVSSSYVLDAEELGLPGKKRYGAGVFYTTDPCSDGMQTDVSGLTEKGKRAYNAAYEKLRSRLHGEAADILTLIRERKQLATMISNRAVQFHELVKEVKRYTSAHGNSTRRAERYRRNSAKRIAAILTTDPSHARKSTKSLRDEQGVLATPAGLILELRWGWMPLVGDIQAALTGLATPELYLPISASAGYRINSETSGSGDYGRRWAYSSSGQFTVKIGGKVRIVNELAHEFERVGMSNYAQSLYETVPYSWLIDYFSSLGDVISSLDDRLVGKLSNVYVSLLAKATLTQEHHSYENQPTKHEGVRFTQKLVRNSRIVPRSIPLPMLVVHEPDLTPWRIATAVSLIVLKLKGFKGISR